MDGITDSMDMSLSKLWEIVRTGKPGVLLFMESQRVTQLNNWTILPSLFRGTNRSERDNRKAASFVEHAFNILLIMCQIPY